MYSTISIRKETLARLDDLIEVLAKKSPHVSHSKINIIASLVEKEIKRVNRSGCFRLSDVRPLVTNCQWLFYARWNYLF